MRMVATASAISFCASLSAWPGARLKEMVEAGRVGADDARADLEHQHALRREPLGEQGG